MSRHGPKDQSKQNRLIQSKGGDKIIPVIKTAKESKQGDNVRQVSPSGGMTPSQTLGGQPTGV